MPKFKWVITVVFILMLTGCGGGGSTSNSGGSGNVPNDPGGDPEPPALQQAAITKANAGALIATSFNFMILSRDLTYESAYLAYLILLDTGGGAFNETFACDNSTGTTSISGSISNIDGTGEIAITDTQCLESQYQFKSDGVIRITIDQAGEDLYPTDYTIGFESYETSSTTENYRDVMEGTIEVSPATGDTQVVSVDIRIDLPITDEYIETDGLKINYAVPSGYYPYPEEVRVAGTIANSEIGTAELSSGTSIADYVHFAGAQNSGIRLAMLDEDHFVAALDADGDTFPEAYLYAAVDDLYENYGVNDVPVIALDDTIEGERDAVTIVSLLDVTDADCDFLYFSLSLLSSPADSRFDWSIDNAMNLLIDADTRGDYVFNLTVNDGFGGVIQKQITLHLLLGMPVVELEQSTFEYAVGDQVAIDLEPSNSDQGPFSYAVSPAIAGMTISSNGLLEWQTSTLEYYFPNTNIEIEVTVSNEDHDVVVPLAFSISDPELKEPVVRSGIEVPFKERNIHVGDFDADGITEILLTDNKNLIYTLEWRSGAYVQDWVYPYEINSPEKSIDSILPLDPDGDGLYEIYVQTGAEIKVISIGDNSMIYSADFSTILVESSVALEGKGIAAGDLDNDDNIELVALFGSDYSDNGVVLVINASGMDLLWQTPTLELGRGLGIGNVDNDSTLEIILSGGFVFDGSTRSPEWIYSLDFGSDIVLGDVDGDGVEEIIANRAWNTPAVYDAVLHSPIFDIAGETDVCSIAAANLDADSQKEIIVGGCQWGAVTAYDADSGSAIEIWSVSSQDHGTESLAVGDADQDGNLEVIWGTGLTSSGEDSVVVFDSVVRTIDFQNVDPSQLGRPYIGGWSITDVGGESRVVFGVADTDSGYAGSRLLSLDFDTGEMNISPEVGSGWASRLSLCVADYDLDGTEEVLFANGDLYNGSLTAYDLFDSTEEWSVTGEYGTSGNFACGDANGDGHPDILAIRGLNIRLYDPFNQVVLWESIQFTSTPTQVALHDLDGDDVPEILALFPSRLVVYSNDGFIYVESGTYSDPDGNLDNVLVEDIDGESVPEIVLAKFYESSGETSEILVLNPNLDFVYSFTVDGRVNTMVATQNNDNTILVATSSFQLYPGPLQSLVKLLDMEYGSTLWQSPPLLGEVTRDSLHIVQKPGSSKRQLAIGTIDAMYITQ